MTDKEEAEANLFAMCLLIPEDMLRADLKRLGIIAFDIEEDAQSVTRLSHWLARSA